jgi:hypothetical protein
VFLKVYGLPNKLFELNMCVALLFLLLLSLFLTKKRNTVRPVLCEGRYFIHMWKALAKLHLFSLKGEVFVLKTSSTPPCVFEGLWFAK